MARACRPPSLCGPPAWTSSPSPTQAAEQLTECGIELIVDELDLTGYTMLSQLQYPNDFDTLMWSRWLGPDPDSAVRAFESSRITSEDNVADENPSGFSQSWSISIVASARETMDEEERVAAYTEVQSELTSSSRTGRSGMTRPPARSRSASWLEGPRRSIGLTLRLGRLRLVVRNGAGFSSRGTIGRLTLGPMALWWTRPISLYTIQKPAAPPRETCICVRDNGGSGSREHDRDLRHQGGDAPTEEEPSL